MPGPVTRRQILIGGLGAAGVMVAGRWFGSCAEAVAAAAAPADKSAQAPALPVAIQRCESYEPKLVRERLTAALNLMGGLGDLVRGKTVTIKLNLTGGSDPLGGLAAIRTYHTHPAVVGALCAILADAGAKQIVIVESFYFVDPVEKVLGAVGWDTEAIKAAGDHRVTFENTRNRGTWPSYSRLKVPGGGLLFPALDVNSRYEKTDVFMSVAKLKDHSSAGITAAMKNLFGITPLSVYGDGAPDENSLQARASTLHDGAKKLPAGVPQDIPFKPAEGQPVWKYRVPRIVTDCVGARPIDLAIVEGIETVTGGEGPWLSTLKPVAPKLIIAGRNAVCTDSVCAAAMGYDPQGKAMQRPYQGENHLQLAASVGIGSNDLKRIEVRGLKIDQAKFPFDAPPAGAAITLPGYYRPHFA
jgi:uncharacterized protein (DUF362 family)